MNSMKLYLALFFVAILSACGGRMKKVSEVNDFGYKVEYNINPKTQLKEGIYKVYDTNGKLYEEASYKAGIIDGTRTLYYPNGNKEVQELFTEGKYNGIFQSFHENGKLKAEGEYANDSPVGKWSAYYPTGQLKDIATFDNGEENGPFIEYYENGKLKAEGNYKDGDNEDGLLLLYDEEGQLNKKMDCTLGRCTTVWKKTEQKS